MKYRTLFSPLTVRGLTLKNRVVVSAMGCLMLDRDRKVSQQLADYLGERAKGGVGLIYSPCSAVDTGSCPEGMLAISTDEIGESHRLLTEAVHAGGAKCAAQLWQGSAIAFPARVYEPSETVLPAALYPALNGKDLVVPPMTKEEILDEGKVDLVVMARANLADPEFCNKAASGREDEIVYCIGCCQGCFDPHMDPENLLNDTHITCLRNPALGKEKEYAFVKTDSPKPVLIAGGGMGGMERGTLSEQREPDGTEPIADVELLRLAVPRRVFTMSQILYAVDRIAWLHENRDLVGGLRWVEEPSSLRFFFGRLEPTSDWQEKLVKKFRDDFGDSL